MEDDTPKTNIFGDSMDKSDEPHEANIFEQAAAAEPATNEPHEANIFEQAAQEEPAEEPESEPEPEPAPEPESEPEPEPEPVVETAAAPTETQPVVGAGRHDVDQLNSNETPAPEKKKKSKKWLVFLIIAILLIGGGIAAYFLIFKKGNVVAAEHEKKTPAPEAFTSIAKLNIDYDAGLITTDEYAKQLMYVEFDSSKLDSKYAPDDNAITGASDVNYLLEFVRTHAKDISEATRKELARHYYLSDVAFGAEEKTTASTGVVLADEEDKEPVRATSYMHRLDSVIASSNKRFLIWYTTTGSDAITDEQANQLASNLEANISSYSSMTGYQYGFESILSNKSNGGYSEMVKKLLTSKGIPLSMITNAMNVYVMNTGSTKTLATYYAVGCGNDSNALCDFLMDAGQLFDVIDEDGAVAWPHVVVNNISFKSDSDTKASQVINHELFHHYQHKLICNTRNSYKYSQCPEDKYYYDEAMANLSSTMVSPQEAESFMGGWSYVYATRSSSGLKNIRSDGGDLGYGQYPYFYSYQQIVDDGYKTLVEAHKETDPYLYIQTKTSQDDLIKVISDAAYRAMAKDYENKSLVQSLGDVVFENDGDYSFELDVQSKAGSTHYYTLGKNWSLSFDGNNPFVTGFLLGKKDGKWTTITDPAKKLEAKSTDYAEYGEVYFAVTNAHLNNDSEYHIKFTLEDAPGTLLFNHKYDNYAVDLTMSLKVSGIKVNAKGSGVVDEKHQREYLKTSMTTIMSVEVVMETYSDFYKGINYYQNPEASLGGNIGEAIGSLMNPNSDKPKWLKQNVASHTIDIDFIAKKMKMADQATKVGDGHYKLKMTAAELKDLMSTANNTSDDANYQIANGEIEVDVYIDKYGRISKLEYDFSSLMPGVEEFTCTMNLSKYNEAGDVMIPPSIVSGAVEESAVK